MYALSPVMTKLQPLGQTRRIAYTLLQGAWIHWLLTLSCVIMTVLKISKCPCIIPGLHITYNLRQKSWITLEKFRSVTFPHPLLRCSGKGKCISVSRIFSEDCSLHQQLLTIFFYFFSEEIFRWSRQGQREIHVGVGSLSENGYLQKLFEEASRKKEKKLATLVPLFWSYHNEKWKTTTRRKLSRF